MLKVATWNVNSLRLRLPYILEWLCGEQPDVLALQETKIEDQGFPVDSFREAGYHACYAGQKSYNGVATLSKLAGRDIVTELPGLSDPQRRVLGARYNDLTVVNVYVPNGSEVGSEKYDYKLRWFKHLTAYLEQLLDERANVLLLGDFNIAPEDRDVHDPTLWEGKVMVSAPERASLQQLLDISLKDTFRMFDQKPGSFSWWDYRGGSFRRNHGLRIDLILASPSLAARCLACRIDKEPRRSKQPSDHAPVIAEFDMMWDAVLGEHGLVQSFEQLTGTRTIGSE